VVEWQTRTLEGRMGQPVQVQVLSRAPSVIEGLDAHYPKGSKSF